MAHGGKRKGAGPKKNCIVVVEVVTLKCPYCLSDIDKFYDGWLMEGSSFASYTNEMEIGSKHTCQACNEQYRIPKMVNLKQESE